jgi:hypothetical protein
MEGPLILATLLQRADFEPVGAIVDPEPVATLRPSRAAEMRIRLRAPARSQS